MAVELDRAGTDEPHPCVGRDQPHVDPAQLREGQEGKVGEGMVEARAAERAKDDDRGRSPVEGSSYGELGIRLVLVDRGPVDRHALGDQRRDTRVAERIAVADPLIHRQPQRARVPGTTIRRDDERCCCSPARPRRIDGVARTHDAVGEDDGLLDSDGPHHGSDASGSADGRC